MDEPVETWTVRIDADTRELEQQLTAAAASGRQFGRALTGAFQGVAIQGKGLTDTVRALALSLSQIALKAAFKPLEQSFSGLLQNLLAGGLNLGGSPASSLPIPFANGGVISSPIAFPLGGGATGIAGERGPEAIVPLTRGSDGKLGVKSTAAAGLNIVFNVTTQDAASFRRTESQIAAMLHRAVAQGQRNL
jgi:phage-related minor tail protein